MTNIELANKLKDIATNHKTLYVMGCFGAPMTAANKKRYIEHHEYNRKPERTQMINAATSDTFGFDCVCLIKGVLWGWTGDKTKTYGGAKYAANGVPDINADSMIKVCKDISTDFSNIEVGEAVWMKGHIGVYIGGGLAVECTPKWDNKVQITACNTSVNGYNRRNWTKHGKLPYIEYKASEAIQEATKPALTGTASTGSAADEKKIWDFLKSKIGNEFGVSGLMGNLNAESALRSNNLQQTFEKKLNYTDITYTKAVDDGTYTNFVKDGAGYGLAQWTYFSRKQKLLDYARSKNKSISDLQMQLEFLYKELSENFNKSVLQKLKTAKSVREASDVVLKVYEAPADQSEKVQEKRAAYGEKYLKKYSTKTEIKPETKPETKPATPTPTYKDFKVGEIVEFTGTVHFTSANSKVGKMTVPGLAKVTAVYANGTHQLHLRAVNKNGNFVSGVYGWVNVSDVKKIAKTELEIGDIVNFTGNTHYISSTSKIGKPTKPSRAKITAINKAGSHKYHLRAINDAGKYVGGGVYGWVNEDDIELI